MMMLPSSLANPFLGNVVDDPWKKTAVSVPTIHRQVFDFCCQAVEYVRTAGRGAGVLIHGQPGSGKTHLLARLREHLAGGMTHPEASYPRQVFISVRLATNPQRIWRHVRQRLVDDLLRRQANGLTQLEVLIAARFAHEEQGEGDLAGWWEYFREEHPGRLQAGLEDWVVDCGASSSFLRVLQHLLGGTQRLAARGWLRGDSLPDLDLERLGLPRAGEDTEQITPPEDEAREVVLALCCLAGAGLPIVFCFDQVEGLQLVPGDLQGLFQFGQLASDLHDQMPNAVLISCIQSDYLLKLRTIVSGFAYDRIRSFGEQSLDPLTAPEAVELVAARLDASAELRELRAEANGRLWPLSEQEIHRIVGEAGCTPRELISQCADGFRRLQGVAVEHLGPEQFLPPIWDQRREAAVQENTPEQTEHILADGLPVLLDTAAPGWTAAEADQLRDVDFVLTGPENEARVGVSFCTQQNMTSLAGRFRRLLQETEHFPKLVMVRDSRTPISKTAARARGYLDELERAGAVLYRPSVEAMAALDALRRLLADADSGDLSVDGRTVTTETVQKWLAEHLADALADMRDVLTGYPGVVDADVDGGSTDARLDELIELLNTEHVIAAEEAARRLNCPAEEIESAARKNPERVGLLQGPPAVLFQTVAGAATS